MSRSEWIPVCCVLLIICSTGNTLPADPLPASLVSASAMFGEAEATDWDESGRVGFMPCPTPGTLFRWSSHPHVTGGPQLNAPLETDRPDFTEASVTVGRDVAQIEFGYTYTRDQDSETREQSFGEPLLRYGILANWLELRMAAFPVRSQTGTGSGTSTESGFEDLYFGMKIGLTPQAGWLPEMAVMPQINVPSGNDALSSSGIGPGACWIYGWELSDEWSTAGQTQWNRAFEDAGDSYLEISQAWVVSRALSDELGAYLEWYALWPSGALDVRAEHYINGGFTFLCSNDIQLDIRAGTGLTDASDDWFVGTGLSVRFR
ncbi:MAG: transporter [Planctomycetaceae bacterium]